MKSEDYIKNALKTEPTRFDAIRGRTRIDYIIRLDHASDGLITEASEFKDALKAWKFYGKSLDETNLIEELGDILWYIAIACDTLKISLEEVMEKNIAKLKARYGDKFNEEGAITRDLVKEAAYPRYILDKMRANDEISDYQYEKMVVQVHEVEK